MNQKYYIILLFLCINLLQHTLLYGEDYQYQYFNKEKEQYVPFSDYIPRVRKHWYTHPHYLEDYYRLYGMKQYYRENSLRKNIARLKTALQCKFRHPSQALVKIETEDEYYKYRNLMFMHINLLIMRNYLKIATRYDKQKIYFYNLDYAEEISKSLDIARAYYQDAVPYWQESVKYAQKASKIRLTTKLSHIESERFSIMSGELDFAKIIKTHLKKVDQKKTKLKQGMPSGEE
jgi:hypothetical protein